MLFYGDVAISGQYNKQRYNLLAFGWTIAGCKYALETRYGVNALEKENVIR